MKTIVQVKLLPTPEQAAALAATLDGVNDAANRVSRVAFERGVPREYELRKLTYAGLTLAANIKAGNLGNQAVSVV